MRLVGRDQAPGVEVDEDVAEGEHEIVIKPAGKTAQCAGRSPGFGFDYNFDLAAGMPRR